MKSIEVFGGQGGAAHGVLLKAAGSPHGAGLLKEIERANPEVHRDIVSAMEDEKKLHPIYFSILATFLINGINSRTITSVTADGYSAYSAGIFNIFTAAELIPLKDMMNFLKARAALFIDYAFPQRMFFFIASDRALLDEIISRRDEVSVSVVTDERSGVLSFVPEFEDRFLSILKDNKIAIRFIRLPIEVPYHSSFLEDAKDAYDAVVDEYLRTDMTDGILFAEGRSLIEEVKHQLDHPFDFFTIKKKIIAGKFDTVFDTSPDDFMKKQMQRMKYRGKIITNKSRSIDMAYRKQL
jgi:malonyl CoA-acyl carrier protein transacylase